MADREAHKAWSSRLAQYEVSHLGLLNHRAQGRNGMGNQSGETDGPVTGAQMQSWGRQGFIGAGRVCVGRQANTLTALWELNVVMIGGQFWKRRTGL